MTGRFVIVTQDCPHVDIQALDYVEISDEPGWQDDGLYIIRFNGSDPNQTYLVDRCKVLRKDGKLRRFIRHGMLRCDTLMDEGLYEPYKVVGKHKYRVEPAGRRHHASG